MHERYRQTTDRQTDGPAIAYSEREREFTFAKKRRALRADLWMVVPMTCFHSTGHWPDCFEGRTKAVLPLRQFPAGHRDYSGKHHDLAWFWFQTLLADVSTPRFYSNHGLDFVF